MSRICANLEHSAPDLQEAILFWAPVLKGRDPIHLEGLQGLAALFGLAKPASAVERNA
jgi:hypothetical protein